MPVFKCCHNSAENGLLGGAGKLAGQGLGLSSGPSQPRRGAAARRGPALPSAAIGAAGLGWAERRGAAQSAGRQQVAALRTELRAPLRTASPRRLAEAPAAAKTPRAVLRVKNGAAKLAKPPAAAAAAGEAPGGAPGSGLFMERSQSRLSLSASFEALAIYFPCMNSFDEEDAGTRRSDGCGEARPRAAPCGRAVRGCAWPSVRLCLSVRGGHGVRGSRRDRAGLCGACRAILPHRDPPCALGWVLQVCPCENKGGMFFHPLALLRAKSRCAG